MTIECALGLFLQQQQHNFSTFTPATLASLRTVMEAKTMLPQRRMLLLPAPASCFLVGLFVWLFSLLTMLDEQHKENGILNYSPIMPDVCLIAEAMKRKKLIIKSYFPLPPVSVPSDSVPHLSSVLCGEETRGGAHITNSPLKSIFAFKAARTGSTFFTNVIISTILQTQHPASAYWEPYAAAVCKGPQVQTERHEDVLRALLTKICSTPGEFSKCEPNKSCEVAENNDTVFITATNPHFLNPVLNWNRVLDPDTRLFSLRRTNLVLMRYSKFHHGGCAVNKATF